MLRKKVKIINKLGLHARASAKLVATAGQFESQIELESKARRVNGKSIMGVMMLAASQGTELELIIDGRDQDAAWLALEDLINSRFGEAE
jgi:phosphocarrier protein